MQLFCVRVAKFVLYRRVVTNARSLQKIVSIVVLVNAVVVLLCFYATTLLSLLKVPMTSISIETEPLYARF